MPADIWNYDDEFHYFYRSAIGDVSVEIFVNGLTGTNINGWAKGGLMLRDSLDANSKHFSIVVTGSWGLSNQWRLEDGGQSNHDTNYSLPMSNIRLKITKTGNVFQTYYHTNTGWIQFGASRTLEFSNHFYYGIAVTSHDNNQIVELSGTSFSSSVITTNDTNNGAGGATMFEVSATKPVTISGASAAFSGTATGPVEIWYKQGSIATNYPGSGSVSTAGGWTLALTGSASDGTIEFGSATIALDGNTIYTFVVNGAGTLGGTWYMTGSSGATNSFTDGTLTIDCSNGRGGQLPSSMGYFPRYFVGSLAYI